MAEGEATATQSELKTYYNAVDKNPNDPGLWSEILEKAIKEEQEGLSSKTLPGISCNDLVALHEELIHAADSQDKFAVLAKEAPDGNIWYEHVLGKTNRFGAQYLLDFINARDYELIVDVGTGSGDSLVPVTDKRKVIGVDLSRSLLRSAKQKNPTALIESNATQLPIKTNSVDCMYSHGLTTHHLSLPDLKKLASEAKRALKPGGNYLEAWSMNNPNEIPESEEHLIQNYKSLLILVLDRIVSADSDGSTISFEQWKEAFESQGFTTNMHRRGNEIVFEFQKPYSEGLEIVRSEYQNGGLTDSQDAMRAFLFPHEFLDKNMLQNDQLTLQEWENRLQELQHFAKDEKIFQSMMENKDFYFLTIAPLLNVINGKEYSEEFQPAAVKALEHNVEVFLDKYIDLLLSTESRHKADRKILERLQEGIKGNPLCASIVQKIESVLTN